MNWVPAHKNCPVIQVNIPLPFKTMLGSPNCLPTFRLFVVLYFLFSDPDWCHLITLLFDFPLLPATTPSTVSHAPQLPAAVISPFSDPSFSSLLLLHNPFPTKTSSNAKINFPPACLHQHPPQSSPLAGDVKASPSLIQGWGNSTFTCFSFCNFHFTVLFPSRHCTGLYLQTEMSLMVQGVRRELIIKSVFWEFTTYLWSVKLI